MNTLIVGRTSAGALVPVLVDNDGSLVSSLTIGDVSIGNVTIDQGTPGTTNGIVVNASALPAGAATEATLATILTNLADPATSAKQDTGNNSLNSIDTKVATETTLGSILTNLADPATQTTLAALNAKVTACDTDAVVIASGNVVSTPVALSRANSSAYANNLVVAEGSGKLFAVIGYNSGPAQFLQVFDGNSMPSNGDAPILVIPLPALSGFAFDFGGQGLPCTSSIILCNSTTGPTLTAGGNNCYFTATFL